MVSNSDDEGGDHDQGGAAEPALCSEIGVRLCSEVQQDAVVF